jgi:uncharacterized RDD family membrane protein YckC
MMDEILDLEQSEVTEMVYAGFWIRFLAAFIDGIIMWIPNFLITMGFYGSLTLPPDAFYSDNLLLLAGYYFTVLILYWMYFGLMESSANQATVGKMAVGIKVVGLRGERISFSNATGRHFAKYLSALILLIGYIMAAFSEKKQALHDKIAGTYVVRK